jgi:hypothetical protein
MNIAEPAGRGHSAVDSVPPVFPNRQNGHGRFYQARPSNPHIGLKQPGGVCDWHFYRQWITFVREAAGAQRAPGVHYENNCAAFTRGLFSFSNLESRIRRSHGKRGEIGSAAENTFH